MREGEITCIRLPKTQAAVGTVITARPKNDFTIEIRLKIAGLEHTLLHTISADEAGREGFTSPDFCPYYPICENIEARIDFESYVFSHEEGTPVLRDDREREDDMYKKLIQACQDCMIKNDAKDLFLRWWESAYHNVRQNPEITKITFELADKEYLFCNSKPFERF
jgi:hypothetical protein